MSETNSIALMLAHRGWSPERKMSKLLTFTTGIKLKTWHGGEVDDVVSIDLSRVDHYMKDGSHLFVDIPRDRVYHKTGEILDNLTYFQNCTSRDLNTFYDHIDALAGGVQQWRVNQMEPKRHTPDQWGKFIAEGARLG